MDVDPEPQSALDTRKSANAPATDFELEDYWDDGVVLAGRDVWPVSVTLNLVNDLFSSPSFYRSFLSTISTKFPGVHFLDATTQEEAAAPLRLILIFSFPSGSPAALHGMHLLGTGETDLAQIESLVKVSRVSAGSFTPQRTQKCAVPQEGEKYALEIYTALRAKLKDEDVRRTEKAQLRFSAAR